MKSLTAYSIRLLTGSALMVILASSCVKDKQSPGYEYMPDMYRGPAVGGYVDYGEVRDTIRKDLAMTKSVRQPVDGTVPFSANALNDLPYTIPDTFEGYEKAGEVLKSPLPQTEKIIAEGQKIYVDFCIHCHGKTGEGDGPVVTVGGHPPPPAYDSPQVQDLPEGKLFHVVTYGKGLMGSHKSQLSKIDRWKVVAYVKTLQKAGGDKKDDTAKEENAEN